MRRWLLAAVVLAVGAGAVIAYSAAARERAYRDLIWRGEAAIASGDGSAAIEAFSGAIALKSDSMVAHLKRGDTHYRQRDLTSALGDLRVAHRLDPAATRPLERLGDIHYALERYGRAADWYGEYARLDDRSTRVLYKLALARYRDGSPVSAIPALEQALALDGRFVEALYLLGLCHREVRRLPDARKILERTVELEPAWLDAREALADLYRSLRLPRQEIEQLEALAALEPNKADRQITLARAHARLGRTDLAVLALGRAIERFPEQGQLYITLGGIWLDSAEARGDRVSLSKALEALQTGLATARDTGEAMTLLGRALFLAGELALSERMLRQATAASPVEPAAFNYLADTAERRGNLAAARAALESAYALADDRDARAGVARAARLGELCLKLGEPAAATRWFQRALDADPDDALLLGRRAFAEWKAGDIDRARNTLKRALAQSPDHPALVVLRRQIG